MAHYFQNKRVSMTIKTTGASRVTAKHAKQTHVDIASPEDLTVPDVGDNVLLGFSQNGGLEGVAITSGHSEVRQESESGDKRCYNVE
jgi:hypothetical protein